jgi:excisionase family DNA binding protein
VSDRLLTARQVADRLALTPETILRWTRRRDLPAFKLPGGAIRYREADLDAWLREHATQGATGRGGDSHPDGRAQAGDYAAVSSEVTATPPHEAATTEEDH